MLYSAFCWLLDPLPISPAVLVIDSPDVVKEMFAGLHWLPAVLTSAPVNPATTHWPVTAPPAVSVRFREALPGAGATPTSGAALVSRNTASWKSLVLYAGMREMSVATIQVFGISTCPGP